MHGRSSFHTTVLVLMSLAALAAGQPWPKCNVSGSAGNYAANSSYEKNLENLMQVLRANSSASPALFASGSSGTAPDAVYGIVLCRGDVSSSDCFDCGTRTLDDVAAACNRSRDVALCYNQCYVRLSDTDFLASTNYSAAPALTLISGRIINSSDGARYASTVMNLLSATMQYAVENTTRMFATGAWKGADPGFPQIYSMAQCTPDLSPTLCRSCLQTIVDNWWSGFQLKTTGARILGERCNLRCETQPIPFYTAGTMVQLPIQAVVPPTLASSPPGIAGGKSNASTKYLVIILPIAVAALAAISLWMWFMRMMTKWRRSGQLPLRPTDHRTDDDIETVKSSLLSLSSIQAATDNFDESTKLGEGGFGAVYKGILISGQEVAVKRLSKDSNQGIDEVKNELVLAAKLHHKNLVQLVGFCLEAGERLLVYEYMPNKSLDTILFDPEKKGRLDWGDRFSVIEGVARGLQYLHEDSQEKIIHRDLKASNVLLDADMNPKIGDFGLARLFDQDQTRDVTSHIAGTFGYMSPEYVMWGHFSTKSDVFSFGILVVEIITGLRNSVSYFAERNEDVISTVWRHWEEGTVAEMIDDSLGRNYPGAQVLRCLHVGLLCLQQNPLDRPTMWEIMVMLDINNGATTALPKPARPTFFIDGSTGYAHPSGTVTRSYLQ